MADVRADHSAEHRLVRGAAPVSSEQTSTRVKVRPKRVKAMDFARTIEKAVPHQRVIGLCGAAAWLPRRRPSTGSGRANGVTVCQVRVAASRLLFRTVVFRMRCAAALWWDASDE